MTLDLKVCVIGAGKMGEALIRGLIYGGVIKCKNILAIEVSEERRNYISRMYGVRCSGEPAGAVRECDIIVIAVKPKDVRGVAEAISKHVTQKNLIVTLAAGVPIKFLAEIISRSPIVRAMPNIAILVGEGMVALARGPGTTLEHAHLSEKIFGSVGRVVWVEEKDMDA
ncbi:NAD(P)-binding domain-containing protein, partial [Candidatus Bathyarchaeota archaeon]|nr:NAD(P)-binding domain-containing protein [Candidatus Bathyarchaeota archaeon]